MPRYIDAEKLREEWLESDSLDNDVINSVLYSIDEAPTVDAVEVVHCEHCTVKKAVQHKDGTIWRCPHRTGDVKMEGYCESGVRVDGEFGRN